MRVSKLPRGVRTISRSILHRNLGAIADRIGQDNSRVPAVALTHLKHAVWSVRIAIVALVVLTLALLSSSTIYAAASLTITPNTWNIIGLDSNNVNVGPNDFPVGVRVCNTGTDPATNVVATFVWDSADPYIDLRPGSATTLSLASLAGGACTDFYFEVEVTRNSFAYTHTREYHIEVTSDNAATVSTPTPRELYVEYLISQNRNGINDIKLDGTSVPAGGAMTLVVGNTYTIELDAFTATQGYNQLESFIHFSNTVFQILSVSTSYSANSVGSPVPNPNPSQYADACTWENDPNSPYYRSCVGGAFKSGGTVTVTYTVKIIGGGGTTETLNTLLYDFSGSSFHYNADYTVGARVANIIDPSNVGISKSFSPNPTSVGGISALTITLTNPNDGALTGYNFVDTFPANMTVATPPAATTTGCGSPTLTAVAGAGSISFTNGTLAANSSCTIKVNVTVSATGTFDNTTGNLFIGTADTGKNASASLVVDAAPPAGTGCPGATLAQWTMAPSQGTGTPPNASSFAANVSTHTASTSASMSNSISTTEGNPVNSWQGEGFPKAGPLTGDSTPYFQFAIDTSQYSSVKISVDYKRDTNWGTAGGTDTPTVFVYSSTTGGAASFTSIFSSPSLTTAWQSSGATSAAATGASLTYFRINAIGANNTAAASMFIDNITITGNGPCDPATISKAFAPSPVAVGGVSTLTFTLTNPNAVPLTGAKFTDSLPSGLEVAATPNASTTCGNTPSWNPLATETTLNFGQTTGATIPANSFCTVQVDIKATTAGPHDNVSGFLSTAEGGTNTESIASASLVALVAPDIIKQFAPSPILPNGVSTLTFTITNLNQNDAIGGVSFTDALPNSPAQMQVAAAPNETYSGCGAGSFGTLVGGETSLTFSGGAIAGGDVCTITVDVTAPAVGPPYSNVSGNVSFVINSQTVTGDTASDSLVVKPPTPAIGLTKQVSDSSSGPWSPYLAVPVGGSVYYRFVIENTGDVPLDPPVSVTDPTLAGTGADPATCSWTTPVPVASPTQDPTEECILGPITAVSGENPNTATARAWFDDLPYDSRKSKATYATTGLTIVKSVKESSFSGPGQTLNYSYLVTNNGFAPLAGPVTIADDKSTDESCPDVDTVGDNDNFLDPGESITCTATYLTKALDVTAGEVTNIATATAGGVTSDPDSKTVRFSPTAADVSNLTAKALDLRHVRLNWQTSDESNLSGFNVLRSESETGDFESIGKVQARTPGATAGGAYHFVDGGVNAGKTYFYKLAVIHLDSRETESNLLGVDVGAGCGAAPNAPRLVSPKDQALIHKLSQTLRWDPVRCADSYRLQVREGSPGGAPVAVKRDYTASRFKLKGLAHGKSYFWRVQACDSAGKCVGDRWFQFSITNW